MIRTAETMPCMANRIANVLSASVDFIKAERGYWVGRGCFGQPKETKEYETNLPILAFVTLRPNQRLACAGKCHMSLP